MNGYCSFLSRGLMWLMWGFALSLVAWAASAQDVEDHLSVPGPLEFSGESYLLAWTSHPHPHLYKQEYLPPGQTPERYRSMLMLDVSFEGITPAQKAAAMVQALAERKKTDPVVNYELMGNEAGTELILDFLLSAEGADGQIVVEWNAYRYTAYGDGVRLVAISKRAYGHEQVTEFLKTDLKKNRSRDIEALAGLQIAVALPAGTSS